ncbi:hypothetical protein ULMS_28140 [Patiriisocius marinistellae]|uniref:Uncharacterized protein n=1 Tax=Patiriisocius marinistellae TaxID=2494560 RepID=A0A5J4G390_9FLAO|nr:hypothetical protein [Patiriisocius marinistellae]GEQ87306.1 hypothetical protein ULMS_28140 [Patiriisocius marinistellae]
MKFRTILALVTVLTFFSCEEDDCDNCGLPTSSNLFNIIFNEETHELKVGYDFGYERETYISGNVFNFYEDSSLFSLSLDASSNVPNNTNKVFQSVGIY